MSESAKIFDGLYFYIQAVGISIEFRKEVADKLQVLGGIRVSRPDHPRCKAIFVFAAKPIRRYKCIDKASPLETCQQQNKWTFHDLCFHFGRVEGDGTKNKQFVVDRTWVEDCIAKGENDQSARWQGKEIIVKKEKKDRVAHMTDTPASTLKPSTAASIAMTPNESSPSHTSAIPSATVVQPPATPIIDTIERTALAEASLSGREPQSNIALVEPPKLLAEFSKSSKRFYVFPSSVRVFVDSTIILHGGLIGNLETADYVLVNASDGRPAILKENQKAISLNWLNDSVEFDSVQSITGYLVTTLEVVADYVKDDKPALVNEASAANIKDPDPSPRSAARLRETRERRIAQIVDELDEWCMNGCPGSRSAFFKEMRDGKQDPFERHGFFIRHRGVIFQALAERGRDVGVGTKVFGQNMTGPRKFSYNGKGEPSGLTKSYLQSLSGASSVPQEHTSTSSGLEPPRPSIAPDAHDPALPSSTAVADPVRHTTASTSTPSEIFENADVSSNKRKASSPAPSSVPAQRKRSTSMSRSRPRNREDNIRRLITELGRWCQDPYSQARTTYLKEMTAKRPGFDRDSLFRKNRAHILQALSEQGCDVGPGSKIGGQVPQETGSSEDKEWRPSRGAKISPQRPRHPLGSSTEDTPPRAVRGSFTRSMEKSVVSPVVQSVLPLIVTEGARALDEGAFVPDLDEGLFLAEWIQVPRAD